MSSLLRTTVALGLPFAVVLALTTPAHGACVPRTGRRGAFPIHGDSEIATNARFLFEVDSWPAEAAVNFKLQFGETDVPGDFKPLFAVGPEGSPHSQYLYEFKPTGGLSPDQVYHYFLTYKVAGSTKEDTHSAVFTTKQSADDTPPAFDGIASLNSIYGSPDKSSMDSGYDCILGDGTFLVAKVKVPLSSEVRIVNGTEVRRDGIMFTAYEAQKDGTVGKKMASSTVWLSEYGKSDPKDPTLALPRDWLFVVEVNPPPDVERCFVVRATDTVGNEDSNRNVKCLSPPGPAQLPPGAGAPGFFGGATENNQCGVGGRGSASLGVLWGGLLLAASRRPRRRG